jgi:hypothetical protein
MRDGRAPYRAIGLLVLSVLTLAACGRDAAGSSPPAADPSPETSSTAAQPHELSLPTLDYLRLASLVKDVTFDDTKAPCLYIKHTDGSRLLAVFPPGSTLSGDGLINIPESKPASVANGPHTIGGGGMTQDAVRAENLSFNPLDCDVGEEFFFVVSIQDG